MTFFLKEFKSYFITLRNSIFLFFAQPSGLKIFALKQKSQTFLIITLVAFAVYFNTLGHQMAYDDEQVIRKNDFVLKGVKGIPDILTRDSYYSFYKNSNLENLLPGGRYRPLSIVSFAIEQQIVGTKHDSVPAQFIWDVNGNGVVDPDEDTIKDNVLTQEDFFARGLGLRHFVNVLFFVLTVGLIFIFFSVYFKSISADVIFIACLLFAIHPIHSEVVANIKSRDEIFSLFFILLTLLFSFRYLNHFYKSDLFFTAFFFFLAVLSKEYALLLLIIIPVGFYFSSANKLISKGLTTLILSLTVPLILYFYLRLNATSDVGNEELFNSNIISNPYLLASKTQIVATKIYVLIKYVFLLFIPYPLISDYSYSTITYRSFASWDVVFSILFYALSIVLTYVLFKKRNVVGFFLFLFLIFLIPVANIFLNIGATMGERLVFHSSLGFCFLLAWPIQLISKSSFKTSQAVKLSLYITLSVVSLIYFSLTFQRNKDWENNETLFSADFPKAPSNLVLISSEARNLYLKAEKLEQQKEKDRLLKKSIDLVDKGLNTNGAYLPLYQTLSLDFFLLKEYDKATSASKAGLKLDSADFTLKFTLTAISKEFIIQGISEYKKGNSDKAVLLFDKAIKADSKNVDAYYNKAYVLKEKGDKKDAIETLKTGIKIDPKNKELKKLLDQLSNP